MEKHAQGKRTVLYPVSVELSKQYCQQFLERGYPAAILTLPRQKESEVR